MNKGKKIMVSLCLVIMIAVAATCAMLFIMLRSDKILKGTYIHDIDVSSMTVDQARQAVEEAYGKLNDTLKVNIKTDSGTNSYKFSEAGLTPDIEKALKDAYSIGRSGNTFKDIAAHFQSAYKSKKVDLELALSQKDFSGFEDKLDSIYQVAPKEWSLSDNMLLTAGVNGKSVDRDKLLEQFVDNTDKLTSFDINLPIKETATKPINLDEVYSKVKQDPQNAKVEVVNNNLTYTEAVPGRDIDTNELSKIVDNLNNKKTASSTLPVKYTPAEISADTIKSKVFKETLASYQTQFYTGDPGNDNRAHNIQLAVQKINGKILGPGETFSFNKTVGPRTEEEGYKVAHVFSDGQVIEDYGGGVCQVSTTLFNAAVYSDMGIVERTNHMFVVGYIDLGQDAAVAYDYVDMKFKNTSSYPIKIVGRVTSDNMIVFSIIGTQENPGRKIEFENETIKKIEYTTKYTEDASLAKGSSYVKTNGADGYVVDTYKIVKENGSVVSRKKIYTSTYNPLSMEIVRGPQ
jgi:Uncharacterized vancomycin resistance protein